MTISCPNCKKLSPWHNNPYRPFCSRECKERDLGNWATERYRIPAEEVDETADPRKKGGGDRDGAD